MLNVSEILSSIKFPSIKNQLIRKFISIAASSERKVKVGGARDATENTIQKSVLQVLSSVSAARALARISILIRRPGKCAR
jgi:hypothetical protein